MFFSSTGVSGRSGSVDIPDLGNMRLFGRAPLVRIHQHELERLYGEHVHAVFRYALRLTRRRDVAEDLTSEAFLALSRNVDGIDATQLPGWLLTVVRHRAIDTWRRQGLERRYLAELDPEPIARSAEAPGLELLESPTLKPIHRECLVLRYAHGMALAEVAGETGLTVMQVKGHLQYARQLLRKDLKRDV